MSFAQRAKAGREESGAFVFPKFEGWTKLKGWKFGLSKKKNPMFTLELKIIEPGPLKGKLIKDRVVISAAADWQFDRFLAYLEDSGIDLNGVNDKDPNYQDIQDILDMLEDAGQKIRLELTPQEEDKRFYRLKFLEVQKVGDAGGPVVEDPADDEPADQAGPVEEEEDDLPAPPPPAPAPAARRAVAPPVVTKPAAAPAATTTAPPARVQPWLKKPPAATATA